jgi:hypothetical protein
MSLARGDVYGKATSEGCDPDAVNFEYNVGETWCGEGADLRRRSPHTGEVGVRVCSASTLSHEHCVEVLDLDVVSVLAVNNSLSFVKCGCAPSHPSNARGTAPAGLKSS